MGLENFGGRPLTDEILDKTINGDDTEYPTEADVRRENTPLLPENVALGSVAHLKLLMLSQIAFERSSTSSAVAIKGDNEDKR